MNSIFRNIAYGLVLSSLAAGCTREYHSQTVRVEIGSDMKSAVTAAATHLGPDSVRSGPLVFGRLAGWAVIEDRYLKEGVLLLGNQKHILEKMFVLAECTGSEVLQGSAVPQPLRDRITCMRRSIRTSNLPAPEKIRSISDAVTNYPPEWHREAMTANSIMEGRIDGGLPRYAIEHMLASNGAARYNAPEVNSCLPRAAGICRNAMQWGIGYIHLWSLHDNRIVGIVYRDDLSGESRVEKVYLLEPCSSFLIETPTSRERRR